MSVDSYEFELVSFQFKSKVGIFSSQCDGRALVTDQPLTLSDDQMRVESFNIESMKCEKGQGGSWVNAEVFSRVWKVLIADGRYSLYDWVVKVDVDTVFHPERFKWHVDDKHMNLNPDDKIYFKNFVDGYPVVGAIEVASRAAIDAMADDIDGCDHLTAGNAEDAWFYGCMCAHGTKQVMDTSLLQHEDHPRPNKCADDWFVALHPYKDAESWQRCHEAAQ